MKQPPQLSTGAAPAVPNPDAASAPPPATLATRSVLQRLITERPDLARKADMIVERSRGSAKPGSPREQVIRAALEKVLQGVIGKDFALDPTKGALEILREMRAAIDESTRRHLNDILHDPKFRRLERSWRGVEYMITNTELSPEVQLRVMNVSKETLRSWFKMFKGRIKEHPLFRAVYYEGIAQEGATPYSCLVGDYLFDGSDGDILILQGMADIAAAAHCTFVAGASPELADLTGESWAGVDKKNLPAVFARDEMAKWRTLRQNPNACHLALTAPRFLGRAPWGKASPVSGMDFEEDVNGDVENLVWVNSAYPFATNLARAFYETGQSTAIAGFDHGGLVADLPFHVYDTGEGRSAARIPVEVKINEFNELRLSEGGLIPLTYRMHSTEAAFISAQSVYLPQKFQGRGAEDAEADSNLRGRLQYTLAVCQIARCLKVIGRRYVGSYVNRERLERELDGWIQGLVLDATGAKQTPERIPTHPFLAARVTVTDVAGNPGEYDVEFVIQPHTVFVGMNADIKVRARLGTTQENR